MTDEELAQLQGMVVKAAEDAAGKLAVSLEGTIEGINKRIDLTAKAAVEVQSKVKLAAEAVPGLIQETVETQLQVNFARIVEEVGKQFEAKAKALTGGNGPEGAGGGLSLNSLLQHSDKLVNLVNAFRSPTTDQAMMGQMSFVMKWHKLLSNLEKGGGSSDDLTQQIAKTFGAEKE